MKTLKVLIGVIMFILSIYLFSYFRYKDTAFILVYHRIDKYSGGLRSLYVSPEVFEKQMKYLHFRGYKCISLDELVRRLKDKEKINKVFCITFDDGYADIKNAYEVLKKLGFKATVYLHMEAVKIGEYAYPHMPSAKMVNIDDLKEMKDVFYVGSHSVSHPDMSVLEKNDVVYEVSVSKRELENTFHKEIKHFCYPYGKVFKDYQQILQYSGYESAVTLKSDFIKLTDEIDLYQLPRIEWKHISSMSIKDFLKNFEFYLKILCGV
ncbi:MAG: polysaccharide deacetylase family protein [Endomicrobia bacterium]|nr:polysaccharide deacetylase family protein [Endomicrobiia bacterium]